MEIILVDPNLVRTFFGNNFFDPNLVRTFFGNIFFDPNYGVHRWK